MSHQRDKKRLITPDATRRRLVTGLGALGASVALGGCDRLVTSDTAQRVVGSTQKLTQAAQRLLSSRESLAASSTPARSRRAFAATALRTRRKRRIGGWPPMNFRIGNYTSVAW